MRYSEIRAFGHTLPGLLDGSEFSENARIEFQSVKPPRDRLELLSEKVAGKKVIHVGFCDHLPAIERRRDSGRWLHAHLRASASRCVGFDVDEEAVAYVLNVLKLDDVVGADITCASSSRYIHGTEWDLLLIPEVLEHVGDPVSFLRSIVELHSEWLKTVVITTPNAFRGGSWRNALRSQECINSDHRFYFTPYTLMKVATDAGLRVRELSFASFTPLRGLRGKVKRAILGLAPMLSEDLVLTADVPGVGT